MTQSTLLGPMPTLAGLLPLVLFLLVGCTRTAPRVQARRLDLHAIQIETPAGWTGGGAGGTYEFRSPDGAARVRVAALEGAVSATGLKDAQLMAGTGAAVREKIHPASTTRVGELQGERARLRGSDGRVYEVVALAVPQAGGRRSVVLVQTSVSAEHASQQASDAEAIFAQIRHSIAHLGAASGGS